MQNNSNDENFEINRDDKNPFDEKGELKEIVSIGFEIAEPGSFEASEEGQRQQQEMLNKVNQALIVQMQQKGLVLYVLSFSEAKYFIETGPIKALPLGEYFTDSPISKQNVLRQRLISLLDFCRKSPRLLTYNDFETVFNDVSLKEDVNFSLMNYYGIIFKKPKN